MPTPAELIAAYAAAPKVLADAVAGMTAEQLRARPIPGKWSALEVVVHLADFEPVYADRIRRAAALKKPLLMGADENDFAANLAYHDRDVAEELAMIVAIRATTARLLRALPAEAWDRQAVHNERGLLTLADLVKTAAGHVTHHAGFIPEKRKALGLA